MKSSLELLVAKVGRHPPLDASENKELLAEFKKTGCLTLKAKIAQGNMRLVLAHLKSFYQNEQLFMDLFQEGMLGVIRAIEKFDVSKQAAFSTYATMWIKHRVSLYMYENKGVKIPINVQKKQANIKKAEKALASDLGRQPTIAEISEVTGDLASVVTLAVSKSTSEIYYESDLDGPLQSYIDQQDSSEHFDLDHAELSTPVVMALQSLTDIEKEVVMMYLGLGQDEMSFQEIALHLNKSRQAIHQTAKRAFDKISSVVSKEELLFELS